MKQNVKRVSVPSTALLAARIVSDLFCEGGTNRKAGRLVLELPGQKFIGSGWCRGAVRDVIERHLKANDKAHL